MKIKFNPRKSTSEGIVAIGGCLDSDLLIEAYRSGIFPWPQDGLPMLWFCPDPRGILDFVDFHVPVSLIKFSKRKINWRYAISTAFKEVVENCQMQYRPNQEGTWITPEIVESYCQLNNQGLALSFECWEDDHLIGGIYGVLIDGVFSGESMFYKKSNASKMCFWKLVEQLKSLGHSWMDIQMVTDVTAAFGGKYISREEFLQRKGL